MNSKHFDASASYLVVLSNGMSQHMTVLEGIYCLFWKKFILKVTILLPILNTTDIILTTYRPLEDAKKCFDLSPMIVNSFRNGQFSIRNFKIYSPLKQFHKCPIRIAVVDSPPWIFLHRTGAELKLTGVEAGILGFLEDHLNFTARLKDSSGGIGMIYNNGSSTGGFKMASYAVISKVRNHNDVDHF